MSFFISKTYRINDFLPPCDAAFHGESHRTGGSRPTRRGKRSGTPRRTRQMDKAVGRRIFPGASPLARADAALYFAVRREIFSQPAKPLLR